MALTNPFRIRKTILCLGGIVLLALLISTSCKKKRAFNEETAQDALDFRVLQGECDEIMRDVNTVILEYPALRNKPQGGAGSSTTSICGASIDTSGKSQGIFLVNYDGTDCYGRIRSGAIKCTMIGYPNVKWKHAGAVIKVELLSYRLSKASDGKGFNLEGSIQLTNESGFTMYDLWFVNQPQLVQRMNAYDLRATFDNGDFVKISMERRLTIMSSNFILSTRVEGIGSADGHSNVENWGQARKGQTFSTEITDPYTWKTSCGSVAPVFGQAIVRLSDREHQLKCDYAVDKDGNDMSWSDNPCPFGFIARWNYKKKSKEAILSYY